MISNPIDEVPSKPAVFILKLCCVLGLKYSNKVFSSEPILVCVLL